MKYKKGFTDNQKNVFSQGLMMISVVFGVILLSVIGKLQCEKSCEFLSTDLKNLKKCCKLPLRYQTSAENSCNKLCEELHPSQDFFSQSEDNVSIVKSCLEKCVIKQSLLLDKKNKIDVKKLALVYEKVFKVPYFFKSWTEEISKAFQECEFGSAKSFSKNLAQYIICIEDFLVNNCVEFLGLDETCRSVEKRFRKCKSIKQDCTRWPIHTPFLERCCQVLYLTTEKQFDDCYVSCQSTEYFQSFLFKCYIACTNHEIAKVISDKKDPVGIDYELAKRILIENSNKSVDWTNVIENSVKNCESEAKAKITGDV